MEDILFDLYLAEMEINENSSVFLNDSVRRRQLLNLVFEKHHVTEEKFDTSLVWYNVNLDKYVKMNENLTQRYNVLIAELNTEKDKLITELTQIDTLFLYTSPTFTLQSGLKENIYGFNVNIPDSVNRRKLDVQFLAMGISDSIFPVFTFCIECKDTTFVRRDTLIQNGWFSTSYFPSGNHPIQSVYGNFYLPDKKNNHLFVKDFMIFQQKTRVMEKRKITTERMLE